MMTQPDDDPVIDEIRAARRCISAHVGNDPSRLVDYYIQLQEEYRERLLPSPQPKKDTGKSVA